MRIESNVIYADRPPRPLKADFFLPETGSDGPLVFFCHGGGWISGDRTMYSEEAIWYAKHGINCATVDYRLAPLHVFPACIADLQDFVNFARERAGEYGYDPERIIAIGNSAGGHLAAMTALCKTSFVKPGEEFRPVNGAVAICPITDLTNPRDAHYPISWSFIEQFLGSLDPGEEVLRAASPISYVAPDSPPLVLIHGEDDDIVPITQSERLSSAMKSVGAPCEFKSLPGEMHSFTLEGWSEVRSTCMDFVRRYVQEGSPA